MAKKTPVTTSPNTPARTAAARAKTLVATAPEADHGHGGAPSYGAAEGMDYPAHEETFHGFTTLVKWSILGLAVVVIFLYVVVHPLIRT